MLLNDYFVYLNSCFSPPEILFWFDRLRGLSIPFYIYDEIAYLLFKNEGIVWNFFYLELCSTEFAHILLGPLRHCSCFWNCISFSWGIYQCWTKWRKASYLICISGWANIHEFFDQGTWPSDSNQSSNIWATFGTFLIFLWIFAIRSVCSFNKI